MHPVETERETEKDSKKGRKEKFSGKIHKFCSSDCLLENWEILSRMEIYFSSNTYTHTHTHTHSEWMSECSVVSDSFATLQAIVCHAPLSMGFPRQEYRSGLPFSSPRDLPNTGVELVSPALAGGSFTTELPWKPPGRVCVYIYRYIYLHAHYI